MYIQEFSHISYDNYGDKNAAKWRGVFKRAAGNMAGIMTVEALTEQLVRELGLSKSLFVETAREIKLEKDPLKWDYGEIGKKLP